jgi:HAD superfamily hydrolase (TIGR01662 family)
MPICNFVMITRDGNTVPASAKPNPRARIWLFDFDNTIAHLESEVDWAAGRRELEAYLRASEIADLIFAEIPKGNLPIYEALRGGLAGLAVDERTRWAKDGAVNAAWGNNGAVLLRDASLIIERYELAGVDRAEPTPGAFDLLEALTTRGKTIAIVTSNSSRTVAHWLERHHASHLVNTIVGRDTLLALKPSPAMVMEALRRLDAHPHDAVFVGDSEADLGAAGAAGIGFYGIATVRARHERLAAAGATEIFPSPAALSRYLELQRAFPTPSA